MLLFHIRVAIEDQVLFNILLSGLAELVRRALERLLVEACRLDNEVDLDAGAVLGALHRVLVVLVLVFNH